jgi:hypothetical protein
MHKPTISLNGMDSRAFIEAHGTINEMLAKYPACYIRLIATRPSFDDDLGGKNAQACTQTGFGGETQSHHVEGVMQLEMMMRGIAGEPIELSDLWMYINLERLGNYEEAVREGHDAVSRGQFHTGTEKQPVRHVITHEWGHVLVANMYGHPASKIGADARRRLIDVSCKALGYSPKVLTKGPKVTKYLDDLARDLSLYGMTQPDEMLAEAFATYKLLPGSSKVADAVGPAIEADYKEWAAAR